MQPKVKLVRDLMPAIFAEEALQGEFYIASNDEYEKALKAKLFEEIEEFYLEHDKNKMNYEMADILEVLDAIMEYYNLHRSEVQTAKELKKAKKGGFTQKKMLSKQNIKA